MLGRQHMFCKDCHKQCYRKNTDSITSMDGRRKEMMCRTKARSSKEEWKWQGGLALFPKLSQDVTKASRGIEGGFTETSRELDVRMQGFGRHIAIGVSLKGVSERDAACAWAVVQPDCDKEEPWYPICGVTLAELEVYRTIKRQELWAFTMVHCRV